MTETDTLEQRLQTVERAVTEGSTEFPEITELAELEERVAAAENRIAAIDERARELEAATQALRGYVGNVRSVNEDVEQRAEAALAATDRLEARLNDELSSRSASGGADSRHQQQRRATAPPHSAGDDRQTGATAPEETDFSAITDGGDPGEDRGSDSETGVLGRLRSLL